MASPVQLRPAQTCLRTFAFSESIRLLRNGVMPQDYFISTEKPDEPHIKGRPKASFYFPCAA
jgi:hypothetical protein